MYVSQSVGRVPALGRPRARSILPLAVLTGCAIVLGFAPAAGAQLRADELSGVVVTVGPPPAGVLEAARGAAPVPFRSLTLGSRLPTAPEPLHEPALAEAEVVWADADFVRCNELLDPVSIEALLADADRASAGRLASLQARCAFGMSEIPRARRIIERALVSSLPGVDAGSADYRQLVDEVRAEVAARVAVSLEVTAAVEHIRVELDGRPSRCTASPCTFDVMPGAHVLVVSALGYERSVQTVEVSGPRALAVALTRATRDVALASIEQALAEGMSLAEPVLHAALETVLDEPIVVLAWAEGARGRAVVFDRTLDRVAARASVEHDAALVAEAVRRAVGEWWGVARTRPIEEDPVFWTIVGMSAAAVAVGVGLVIGLVPTGEPDVVVRF